MYLLCLLLLLLTSLATLPHPPLSLALASLLSPLVVRLLIFVQSGWVLSGLSSCARSGRRRRVHREKLDLLARSQILLGTPPPPTPTMLCIRRSSSITRSNGKLAGGHISQGHQILEGKKCQVRTTVFSNDAVPLRCTTRLRLALMHQCVPDP